MKKLFVAVGGLIVVLLAVWLGASIYVGRSAEKFVATITERNKPGAALQIVNVKHNQSLFSATGSLVAANWWATRRSRIVNRPGSEASGWKRMVNGGASAS